MNEKNKEKLKKLMSSDKSLRIIITVGLLAVVLIFLSGQIFRAPSGADPDEFDIEDYRSALASDVASMVESVDGAGKTKILLTLENSYEYIYLADNKTLQKINEPKVRGVVVACEGGDSAIVCEKITRLIVTALDIPSTKVCITKLS